MPYVACSACGLRFHAVAAHSTIVRCPECDVALPGVDPRAAVASADAGAVHGALATHGVVLLTFFVRRALEAEAGIALWAETVSEAHLAARRLCTSSEAVAWLDAMAYRQLARYRASGRADVRALRRLGLALPQPDAGEILDIDLLADLPHLRALAEHALATLPERSREMVRLRVVERRPVCEVAARMRITEDHVRSRVSRDLRVATQAPGPVPPADAIDELPALRAWLWATPELHARAGRL